MTEAEMEAVLDPKLYIGRCPEQVDAFLAQVRPLLSGAQPGSPGDQSLTVSYRPGALPPCLRREGRRNAFQAEPLRLSRSGGAGKAAGNGMPILWVLTLTVRCWR